MEITSVSLIRRWPCIDKRGYPLDYALHSFRDLFINIFGHFWGLRISCFSPEHLVQVKAGTLTTPSHRWELVESDSRFPRNEETSVSRLGPSFLIAFLLACRLLEALQENIKGHLFSCGGKEGRR